MNKDKIEEISGSIYYIEHKIRGIEHFTEDLKSEINIIKDMINNELMDKEN